MFSLVSSCSLHVQEGQLEQGGRNIYTTLHQTHLVTGERLREVNVSNSGSGSCNNLTVAHAVEYWLENRLTEVRRTTWKSYKQASTYIVGPLLVGNKIERYNFARRGTKASDAQFMDMLGPMEISKLTTAEIRAWHKTLTTQVSGYTANVAKKVLRAALCLAAEDLDVPLPNMPTRLGRGRAKPKKTILTPEQVGRLLSAALCDKDRGIYYAFPFLTGVRPSEQLALLWEDVDFNEGVIHIRRTQDPNGCTSELTKTDASVRQIPMSALLRGMLLDWYVICPQANDKEQRIFPCVGRRGCKHAKTHGRPLSYANFIHTYWHPALVALDLPRVTPHSARHLFISTLQANGIEVGLVAKLVGHANVTVTLSHYTQAVRGGDVAIRALETAYHRPSAPGPR
jgi:integrase